jgi:predicted RNA-binding protein with RPS1 domain
LNEFPDRLQSTATITSVLSYGALCAAGCFGVEGLVHASEIPQAEGKPLKDILREGRIHAGAVLAPRLRASPHGLQHEARLTAMPDPRDPRRKQYEQDESPGDWLERLARFNTQFGRFVRDAFGVALIAFALMSLLARMGTGQTAFCSRPSPPCFAPGLGGEVC